MTKKEVLQFLATSLEQGYKDGILFHARFLEEFRTLLKDASGHEKEILNLLVRQLGYVRDFGSRVNEVDGNEKIKYGDREYYSLHLQGKEFNLRFLMGFLADESPVFLVAFYERSGKRVSDYSGYIDVLGQRYKEIESEYQDEK